MNHNICPQSPDISDDAHRAAYYRWCLEYIVNEQLLAADMYLKGGLGSISAKDCQVRYEAIVTGLMKRLFNGTGKDGDFWDTLWPGGFDAFISHQKRQLSLHHCGDCTAVAASCWRCVAEALYGLPSSVTWSRHEGFALLSDYNTKATKAEEK
jgi:hypothetical protein